jgi:hypothetical protein
MYLLFSAYENIFLKSINIFHHAHKEANETSSNKLEILKITKKQLSNSLDTIAKHSYLIFV